MELIARVLAGVALVLAIIGLALTISLANIGDRLTTLAEITWQASTCETSKEL